ncbi:MAG: hypothetical protein KC454_00490 [Flavobacteriales bacterium]|nr:hypothetical protein [Flavobacteriales bacterium]
MMKILSLIVSIFVLGSCVKNNPDPSWITINGWQLIENPNNLIVNTGVLTHNITEAWVYADNDLMGVFELPVTIPLLISGNKEMKIYPAIRNNGIASTKKVYPFLEPYTITANLIQNEEVVINPITQYYSSAKFNVEDFENGGTSVVQEGPTSNALISYSSDPAIYDSYINGGEFMQINIDETNNTWVASTIFNGGGTTLNMPLPIGRDVYLEIDYHTTNKFTSGLIGVGPDGITDNPNVTITASEPGTAIWKKIYIDLREIVSGMQNKDYYEFSFQAPLDEDESSGQINIDNLKAVYF